MGGNYKKAKYSELIESIDTQTEKELLKRDIGSNFQLNLFQETTFLWSLCSHSQFCWALGMPWMLHMGIPLSQWGNPSCEHPCTLPSTAWPPRALQVSWRNWAAQPSPCDCLQTQPAGKPGLLPWPGHILQKPGSITAKNLCGGTAQGTAHWLGEKQGLLSW